MDSRRSGEDRGVVRVPATDRYEHMQAVVDVNATGNDVSALLPGERAQLGKRVAGIIRPRQDRAANR